MDDVFSLAEAIMIALIVFVPIFILHHYTEKDLFRMTWSEFVNEATKLGFQQRAARRYNEPESLLDDTYIIYEDGTVCKRKRTGKSTYKRYYYIGRFTFEEILERIKND